MHNVLCMSLRNRFFPLFHKSKNRGSYFLFKILLISIFLLKLFFLSNPPTVFAGPGDKAVYQDTSGTHDTNNTTMTGVPFNNQVKQDAIFTQNANDIDVDLGESGKYLYGYIVQSRNDSYNKNMSFISRVTIAGTEALMGHGSGYRNDRNDDRYYSYGYGLASVTSGNDIRVEALRQGTNSSSHLLEINKSSFWILKLDDTWDYLRLQGADNQSTSSTIQNINFTTSIENTDTNIFGHSTSLNPSQITLKEAGHYLVVYNIGVDSATSTTSITSNIDLSGTNIPQSFDYAHIANSSSHGSTTNISIIEADQNDILRLEWGSTGANANGTQTRSDRTSIAIIRLPDTAEYLRVYGTSGTQDIGGLNSIIAFNTSNEADSGSFVYNTTTNQTTIQNTNDYLFTTGARSNRTTGTTVMTVGASFYVNGTIRNFANTGTYVAGTGSTQNDGGWSGAGLLSLNSSDVIDFRQIDDGSNGGDDRLVAYSYGISAINIGTLFTAGNVAPNSPQTPYVNDTTAQAGQASPVVGITDLTPAFSAIFDDNNTTDTSSFYQVQVGTDTDWATAEMWDSTKSSMTTCNENSRCEDIIYNGSALSYASTYYWRIRFWDNSDVVGAWSSDQQFTTANPAAAGDTGIYQDTNGTFETNNTSYTGVPFNSISHQDPTFTQNANDIDVNLASSGHYLYGYSIQARDDAYRKPISFLTRFLVGGSEETLGHGQGYREDQNNDRYYSYGYGMFTATAGDNARVEVIRNGTNSNSHILEANRSSFWLLKLSEFWDYLTLHGQDNQSTTTSNQNINFVTLVENTNGLTYEHSISVNPDQIKLKQPGHYLVVYGIGADGANASTSITSRISINGTPVPQSYDYTYISGSAGITEGAVTNMSIIEADADDILTLNWGATGANSAGNTQTMSNKTGISIVKLPNGADFLRIFESTTPQDIGGLNTAFTYDTGAEVDESSFSYNSTNGQITTQKTGYYLFTSGARSNRGTTGTTYLMSAGTYYVEGTVQYFGNTGLFSPGNGVYDGGWASAGLLSLSTGNTVDFRQIAEGEAGDADQFQTNAFGITSAKLDSLFFEGPQAPETPYVNNNTAQTGQPTPVQSLTDPTPAFSSIFIDTNTSETATFYQLQVGDDTDWSDTAELWDSTKTSITSCNHNSRCNDVIYNGLTLNDGQTYYWRMKYWNSSGIEGQWSLNQRFTMNQAPSVNNVTVNGGSNISLSENSTVSISWTADIVDINGATDISSASGKLYRSSVSGGSSCTDNPNNCYSDSSCSLSSCSGSSCVATCTADIYYLADPTDAGSPLSTEYWLGYISATDNQSTSGNGTSNANTNDVLSLIALNTEPNINFGSMFAGENSGTNNSPLLVTNTGNRDIDSDVSGTDMCDDYPTCAGQIIPVGNMEYSTSTFTYGSGTTLTTTPTKSNINLAKPTVDPSNANVNIYWGISIPITIGEGTFYGDNFIVAVGDT